MRGTGCTPLHPTVKLPTNLATTTQRRSLSPVTEPVHEDPCAAVGDGGQLVAPIAGDGSVAQPSPDQRLLRRAVATPSARALKKINQRLQFLFLPPSVPPVVWMIY